MNRKLIAGLCILALLSGCGTNATSNTTNKTSNKQNISQNTEVKSASQEEQTKIMDEYAKLIKENKSEKELFNFVDKNIEKLSKDNASKIIFGIDDIQKKNINDIRNKFFQDDIKDTLEKAFGAEFTMEKLNNMEDSELKTYILDLIDGGYKLMCESYDTRYMYYPTQDYSFFKKYNQYVNNDVKDYVNIMATISDNADVIKDDANVDWNYLLGILSKSENYLNSYSDSPKKEEIKQTYIKYLQYYLLGGKNATPFDSENKLTETAKKSYESIDLDNKDSLTSKIMKEYLSVLNKNHFKFTDEVREHAFNVLKNLQEEIK